MPYIPIEQRRQIDTVLENMAKTPFGLGYMMNGPGELNYLITKIIKGYLDKQTVKYTTLNEIVGVLECVKAEFQRRVVGPYEDRKTEENGDVY